MNEPQDFIALVIAIMAALTSKEIAILVGPYAAILVLAIAGAGVALNSNEKITGPMASLWFVTLRVLLAITLTVSLAEWAQKVAPSWQPRYTIAPIAFLIGFVKDYDSVRSWIGGLITDIKNLILKRQGNG